MNIQQNRSCDAANRKITGHAVVDLAEHHDLIAPERDLGEILNVEKVRAAEVGVARLLTGPDLARIYDDFDGRACSVFRIEFERAVYVLKMPAPSYAEQRIQRRCAPVRKSI